MEHQVALITGVSRRGGIGFAIASRLAQQGFNLMLHHFSPHDAVQPWGGDDIAAVVQEIKEQLQPGWRLIDISADLQHLQAPAELFAVAVAEFGHVEVLVANHARPGVDGALSEMTAEMLDGHWAVNTGSSLLLAQELVQARNPDYAGSIVFLTSGQQLGPLPGEIGYGSTKAALAGITKTIAHELAPENITVNCVNPGPVDSDSYVTDEMRAALAGRFPFGRWGLPDAAARLISWLVSEDGRWITGQVLNSEGGFVR